MLVYWFMFAVPAFSTLALGARRTLTRRPASGWLIFTIVMFVLLIGLRYRVGTDWFNYQRTIFNLTHTSFGGALLYKDPAFGVLAWISIRIGLGIYLPNFICGLILMVGLTKFVRRQSDMWLAITAAVPYLLIVVGMGYVRQSASIGLLLIALGAFEDRRYYRFLFLLGVASLFHASSLTILPLAGIALVRNRKTLLVPLLLIAALFYGVLLQERVDALYTAYVARADAVDSSGTLIRLVMNAVPAVLFLLYRRSFRLDDLNRFLWSLFSYGALFLFVLLFIIPSSTAVDRVGLYFIPLQLYVFGNISTVLSDKQSGVRLIGFLAILYYAAVQFVWLTFAANAEAWLPYRVIPSSFPPF